jgi:hypothetical protein
VYLERQAMAECADIKKKGGGGKIEQGRGTGRARSRNENRKENAENFGTEKGPETIARRQTSRGGTLQHVKEVTKKKEEEEKEG